MEIDTRTYAGVCKSSKDDNDKQAGAGAANDAGALDMKKKDAAQVAGGGGQPQAQNSDKNLAEV